MAKKTLKPAPPAKPQDTVITITIPGDGSPATMIVKRGTLAKISQPRMTSAAEIGMAVYNQVNSMAQLEKNPPKIKPAPTGTPTTPAPAAQEEPAPAETEADSPDGDDEQEGDSEEEGEPASSLDLGDVESLSDIAVVSAAPEVIEQPALI